MVLWLSLAFLTLLVLVVILRPLLVREARVEGGEDAEVYAAQLREVAADRERGLIGEAEAEAARAEIGRRLLRARHDSAAPVSRGRGWGIAAAVAVVVPLVSLGLYAALGTPTYGDQPLALRLAPVGDEELKAMVAKAEARLAERPDDGDGWAAVAPVYLRMGRFADAAAAYGRAIDLLGPTDDRLAGRAEALTFANEGEVPEEARTIFADLAAKDATAVAPRIFLAIAARQRGDFADAAERWRALIGTAKGDEPWLEIANAEFVRMGGDNPVIANDPVGAPPAGPGPRVSTGEGSIAAAGAAPFAGPDDAQVAAAAGMTDEARQAMIAGMVDRLRGRLETAGGTADEWLRLIHSLQVLGRTDDARQAAEKALASLSGEDRDRLAGAAEVKELLE
jgi:cytochrome c-type biogenesis protein CcmH